MSIQIVIDGKERLIEATTDSRGRVTLGSEYGNKDVTLAVVDVEGEGDD